MYRFRIYADTSVIGGCLDKEFAIESQMFMQRVRKGKYQLLLSETVLRELEGAPKAVRDIVSSVPVQYVEMLDLTEQVIHLRDAYLDAGVVTRKWMDDATHVALATVARSDAIVSWNFKHIVQLDKMKAYNQVNLLHGYGILTIVTPKEVVRTHG